MPSLMAILGFDYGPFIKGTDAAQAKARSTGKGIESAFGGLGKHLAGFATVGGITAAVHSTIEYASKINDLSLRLGISTDDVQKWDYALKQNGSSIDEAVPFFEKLGKARLRALAGNEDDIKAFEKFGIGMDAVKGNVSDIGLAISDVYKAGGDPQQLIGAMTQLGGKGAESMVAAFRDGVRTAFAEAPVISPADIEAIDAMGDKLSKLKAEGQSVLAHALVAISNGLTTALEAATVLLAIPVGALMGAYDAITKLLPQVATWSSLLNPVGAAAKLITGVSEGAIQGTSELVDSANQMNAKAKIKRDEEAAQSAAKRTAKEKTLEAQRAASVESESDEKTKKTAKLKEELAKKTRANELAEETTSERLHSLTKERRDVLKSIPGLTGDKQIEAQIKAADLDKEIAATMEKKKAEVAAKDKKEEDWAKEGAKLGQHHVTSEQQLGMFFGNYASAGASTAPELAALNVQMKSEQHLAKIVQLLGGGGSAAENNQTAF